MLTMKSTFDNVRISFEQTNAFDSLLVDYLSLDQGLKSFYNFFPSPVGFKEELARNKREKVNRTKLVTVLREQYQNSGIDLTEAVRKNIELLLSSDTYTVTTGHQLNLFTGPLYFIYKILTTINLAEKLKANGISVVPVYWMATEDHDMEEIRSATIFAQKLEWETTWTGASGQAPCSGIAEVIELLKQKLGTMEGAEGIISMMISAYEGSADLSEAMRKLVHTLFHSYGLIILDANDARLKADFLPVILDDLQKHSAEKLVSETTKLLEEKYHVQVHPRNINLFYIGSGTRERLIQEGSNYHVSNPAKTWSMKELTEEVSTHPERFSPNVVLRPLYQESILPNLAMIGGPAEIAYWLEYKSTFDHFGIPFPALVLRSCFLIIDAQSQERLSKFGIRTEQIFDSADEWIKIYLNNNPDSSFSVDRFLNPIESEFIRLGEEVSKIDASLKGNVEAEKQKLRNGLKSIEEKVIRARKKKNENEVNQIVKLKEKLFPGGGLQERVENFIPFYLKFGSTFFDQLLLQIDPFDQRFNVLIATEGK